jgi:uncharacterized membrane protein YesL
MRELPGLTGTLYVFAEWVMRFSVSNLLWFILNLPLMFVLLSVYINGFSDGFIWYLLPLAVLVPVLSVPSTMALFAAVREWILLKDPSSITKSYFLHIKANYRKSFFSGILLLSLWLVWLLDFYFFQGKNRLYELLFIGIGLGLFVYTVNFFSLSVHYQMKYLDLVKNSFYVTIGNPLLGLFILISNGAVFYVSATRFLFLLPLFAISISVYLSFLAFYRFSLKIQRKVGAIGDSEQ